MKGSRTTSLLLPFSAVDFVQIVRKVVDILTGELGALAMMDRS